jgi:hypothetical protein
MGARERGDGKIPVEKAMLAARDDEKEATVRRIPCQDAGNGSTDNSYSALTPETSDTIRTSSLTTEAVTAA